MQRAALSAGRTRRRRSSTPCCATDRRVLATPSDPRAAFVRQLASIIGARQKPAEVTRILDAVSAASDADASWWRAALLEGLAQGAQGRRSARPVLRGARAALLALVDDSAANVRAGALALLRLAGLGDDAAWRAAVQRATATSRHRRPMRSSAPMRSRSCRWIVPSGAPAGWRSSCRRTSRRSCSSPRWPRSAASIRASSRRPAGGPPARRHGTAGGGRARSRRTRRLAASCWRAGPGSRPTSGPAPGDVLIDDPTRARLLVEALSAGTVPPWSLGFSQKQDLVLHKDPSIRAMARAVLEEDPRRQAETVRRYAAALDLGGEPSRGAQVFARACAGLSSAAATSAAAISGRTSPRCGIVRRRACWPTSCCRADRSRSTTRPTSSSGGTATRPPASSARRRATTITLRQADGRELAIRRGGDRQDGRRRRRARCRPTWRR